MRVVLIKKEEQGQRYLTLFLIDGKIVWEITSYTWLPSPEQIVAWVEDAKHPIFNYV